MGAQAVTPIFKPLGLDNGETTASLITGVIAKEMVVSTMGVIYATASTEDENPEITVGEELLKIVSTFGAAYRDAVLNVVSIATISSISVEEGENSQKLRNKIQKTFTPLTAYTMMVFVLLYMPCLVTGAAIKHKFGSWKLFYIATVYGMILAWIMAFIIYRGGLPLGLED